ncbi:MAG: AMP-binding protein [Candidatus Methanomethylophilaceae archaeon]|nr:AMP-binding protein [Candidatus Methanomethylophilaceae archaeon]
MRKINERYTRETYDENGLLKTYRLEYPENYNFGYDIVDDIAVNDPQRIAMYWDSVHAEPRKFTFADIKRMSDKTANFLAGLGITKGDRVMVILKVKYQFWFTIVALHKLGAIAIPATHMLMKHDVEYRVRSAEVKAVICMDQNEAHIAVDTAEDIPSLKYKIMVGAPRDGWLDFDSEVEKASEVFERRDTKASEPMLMYFTSGTSGNPKMVMHSHVYSLAHIMTAKHWHQVDPEGIHFTIADTGWGKAVWGKLYGQWIMESAVMVYEYDKFNPSEILDLIEKYRITTLCCPPTMFRMFINAGLEGHDLSSLKNCCIAGEALNPDTYNTWLKQTGLRLMEGYGQTETTLTVANLRGMTPKPGSMGKPSPQFVADIVDEEGNSVPAGVNGELVFKADCPGIMIGYYRDPEKTKETLRGGWHHTGDVVWKDEDGYIWYVGRNDDIIKSSGYRISPFEIESALLLHPSVLECAVTGVPDEVRGQLVKATIVLRPGYEPTEDLKKDIQNFTKKETAPYKYPRVVEFVDEIPKSINGKIRRVVIRKKNEEEYAKKHSA